MWVHSFEISLNDIHVINIKNTFQSLFQSIDQLTSSMRFDMIIKGMFEYEMMRFIICMHLHSKNI